MIAYEARANGYGQASIEMDGGSQHREMAIDVPSNFVPQPKVKPTLSGSLGRDEGKVKKYQKEIQHKKEMELKLRKDEEFLRASLRESKKLQNLEKGAGNSATNTNGFVNTAYDHDQSSPEPVRGAAADEKTKSLDDGLKVDMKLAVGMQQILALMNALRSKLGNNSNELRAMNQLFNDVKFQDSVSLFNQVHPDGDHARDGDSEITPEMLRLIQRSNTRDAQTLREAIGQPTFKDALLPAELRKTSTVESSEPVAPRNKTRANGQTLTQDTVSADLMVSRKSEHYPDISIKLVTINKTTDPLGATVRNDGDSVIVGRIVKGGVAERSGEIHEGDELLEVNDVPLRGKTINEVSDLLAELTGELRFLIAPLEPSTASTPDSNVVTVRALFDYDPEKDQFIPCIELGITFQVGDILHIIDQSDTNWWQAFRDGEEDQALAGLVPSKTFWETREQARLAILAETEEAEMQTACCARKKRKKSKFNADEVDSEEILTYEEVSKYYPQPNRKRPIVLIGPPDVGRKELREKLQEYDPERFDWAIPHTSRPRKENEVDGKDYYFTASHIFEADIKANKFVEHGLYQKDYYGTSIDAIKNSVNSGKICILHLHPQAIKALRASDVKPYVVFVAPPGLDKLRQNILEMTGRHVAVEHCSQIIEKGREIENKYGHYFDFIISNKDFHNAFNELLKEINRLEIEPQWVPSEWVK